MRTLDLQIFFSPRTMCCYFLSTFPVFGWFSEIFKKKWKCLHSTTHQQNTLPSLKTCRVS